MTQGSRPTCSANSACERNKVERIAILSPPPGSKVEQKPAYYFFTCRPLSKVEAGI